jgi:hypothetical protein
MLILKIILKIKKIYIIFIYFLLKKYFEKQSLLYFQTLPKYTVNNVFRNIFLFEKISK